VRADSSLLVTAQAIATDHGISVYDAAYVAAARGSQAELVSCDVRDLVSKGLARLPGQAVSGAGT
jgi:predicted nucleic acid-binding protein